MTKVRTYFNYQETKKPTPETANMPSLTVPDQTLSLKELIRRHAQGRHITTLTGSYQEDGEYDELMTAVEKMSELERMEYLKTVAAETKAGFEEYERNTASREAAAAKAAKDAEAAALAASEEARLQHKAGKVRDSKTGEWIDPR